ncbi:MAG TPA: AAA family ATPase [Solirubrobacteraceae bacterium]|nr:AAA family ATPase [Solirubrobacteraceae bacterium]
MLVGRDAQQRGLDALLQSARDERSAVLVIRGEAGIGKTALLDYAAERATGMRVLRCVGVEAEHELPFAGIHQLLRPCVDLVDRLPAPQAAALNSALGLSFDGVPRPLPGVARGAQPLAEACDETPVLCCVDDAQWPDRPSADALVFAARRLQAEPIAMLLAAREGDTRRFEAPGLYEMHLSALDDAAAEALIAARLDRPAAADVVAKLLGIARGNPLALLELPTALSEGQLAGVEPILGPPPVRGAVEATFGERVARLPDETRLALLVAALEEAGDLPTVERAAGRLEIDASALDVAERAGLVHVDSAVAFRHPLVRSAVHAGAAMPSFITR